MKAQTAPDERAGHPTDQPTLRRELHFPETAAVSIGVMAPTLAMSITGIAAAQQLGRAAPLAFVLAGLGVGLVAFGFVRLAAEFSHAGSVYAFVGKALTPRMGFVAGWALLGTYLVFPPVSIMGVAIFGRAFLHSVNLADDADWFPIALVGWAVIWFLAARGIRPTTRSLLAFEVVSVVLILVLVVTIYVRLATGTHSAGGGGLSANVLVLPPGTSVSTLAIAATSGFLAFAGFESAGSLGEESMVPRRAIPHAIIAAVAFGAVFYVACMVAQSLGFGLDASGVSTFQHSQAPLGDLADRYVGGGLPALLDAGAVLSAVGAGLGGVTVAARMMFAFGRDGLGGAERLGAVSPRTRVPVRALTLEMLIGLVFLVSFRFAGVPPLNVFFYLATLGVLSLLVMYVLTNVAAVWRLSRRSRFEAVLPIIGTGVAGFVLYHNVWPVPSAPYRYFPYVVLGWLITAMLISVVVPGLVTRVRDGLARHADE
jgi:amino acid transporter